LSLPADWPRREEILTVAFGVAAFSIVVQSLTAPFAMRGLGLVKGRRR
jgi:NhaP-type Na+/H+ or K+/H+ antiporter